MSALLGADTGPTFGSVPSPKKNPRREAIRVSALVLSLSLGCSASQEPADRGLTREPAMGSVATEAPALPLYVEASALAGLPPQKAVSLLRESGVWKEVSYSPKTGLISLKAMDGTEGLVQYSRGVLLSLRLSPPRELVAVSKKALAALGIRSAPEPTMVNSRQGSILTLKWERGFDQFYMVIITRLADVTVLGVDYVPPSVLRSWEQAE